LKDAPKDCDCVLAPVFQVSLDTIVFFDDKSTISIPDTSSDDELTDNPSNFIFTKFPPRKAHKKNSPQQQKKQPTVHPTTNSQTLPRIPMNTQNGNQLKDHHSDISIYSIASSDDE
jgi:hypothetical protein